LTSSRRLVGSDGSGVSTRPRQHALRAGHGRSLSMRVWRSNTRLTKQPWKSALVEAPRCPAEASRRKQVLWNDWQHSFRYAGYLDDWRRSVRVTTTTHLEQEHGMTLTVGTCVEVEYYLSGTDRIATKIEAQDRFRCNTPTFTNKAYGTLAVPAGADRHVGHHPPGGALPTRSARTPRPIQAGARQLCARVHACKYATIPGRRHHATEIETQSAERCRARSRPACPATVTSLRR